MNFERIVLGAVVAIAWLLSKEVKTKHVVASLLTSVGVAVFGLSLNALSLALFLSAL